MVRPIARRSRKHMRETTSNASGIKISVPQFDFSDSGSDTGCGAGRSEHHCIQNSKAAKFDLTEGATNHPTCSFENEVMQWRSTENNSSASLEPRTIMTAASQNNIQAFMRIFESEKSKAIGKPENEQRLQTQLNCALVQAVTARHGKMITAILDLGAQVDVNWYPITNYVICFGMEDILDIFLARGVTFGDGPGTQNEGCILHQAARIGNASILMKLLKQGSLDVNSVNSISGQTPLHTAVQYSKNICANVLIDAGADVKVRDSQGRSALHEAASRGNNSLIKRLLDMGVDPNIADTEGKNAWFHALNHGHIRSADLIMAHMHEDHLSTLFQDNMTYLHLAASRGNPNITRRLLELGCDATARDIKGNTPLMHIVTSSVVSYTHLEILIKHPGVCETVNMTNNEGETALSLVFKSDKFRNQEQIAASALLGAGADINLMYQDDRTLLLRHILCDEKREYLLKNGADPNYVSSTGMNVFWAACHVFRSNTHRTVELLIESNVDIRLCGVSCSPSGTSAFVEALRCGNTQTASTMYHAGCSLSGVAQWLKTEEATEVCRQCPHTADFIEHLKASGKLVGPQSLWEQARLAILPALGPSQVRDKVYKLDLPVTVACLLDSENFSKWHKHELMCA